MLRLWLGFSDGAPPMLILYMIPVILSASVGGVGAGLFCTCLAALFSSYFLLPPADSFAIDSPQDLFNWFTMVLTGAAISVIVEALHRTKRRIENEYERYRVVADNTYDWEFWLDPLGRSLYQSPSCKRITGYTAPEFAADPGLLERMVHPEDLPAFKAHRHGVVGEQVAGELQFRIIRPDGSIRWIEHFCQPVFDSNGGYLGARGSNSDITGRKMSDQALRESEQTFKKLFDESSDPILLMRGGRFIECNEAAVRLIGAPDKESFLGATPLDISPEHQPDGRLSVDAAPGFAERAFSEGNSRFEWLCRRYDGAPLLIEVSLVPIMLKGERLLHNTWRDITERKRVQEVLVQTEKLMSVGGLAAGMAHEINNPLAGILQSVQVIRRRLDERRAHNRDAARACGCELERVQAYLSDRRIPDFLENISQAGQRASRIVANMLEFSRKSDQEFTPRDLADVVDKSVDLAASDFDLNKKYDFKSIRIIRDYDPELPPVKCDPAEMQQVVFNLLKNAAQALAGDAHGEPVILLRTRRRQGMAAIEVEDNGPGIPPEAVKHVFEPFFTTKGPGHGTGLGLSVSYYIVTAHHGGRMSVESSPGGGAKFVVDLPA
jgi:PAS domain S-box-containing protein